MHKLICLAVSLALVVSPLVATAPVPRKSPELKFFDPSGKEKLLSSFNGKVVVIEFLLVKCPHCLRVAQTINQLYIELGPRGFQPIGIAFDNGISGPGVTNYVQHFKIIYPVEYTSSANVDTYLGRAGGERLQVPQIVVIDRKGVIRAQSRPVREVNLENENYLRNLIDTLLKETASTAAAK
jgi:thiol-disulfide isomerase/thioredoxin